MNDDVSPPAGIEDRLAALIRIPTVSAERSERSAAFAQLPRLLETLYPRIHAELELEVIDDTGLLYRWAGTRSDAPLILMAHWDVVPAIEADSGWTHDPFSGDVSERDGERWVTGRGALDDKGPLVIVMDAVENLLAEGFKPTHDVYLALGGDEEVMGSNAAAMSKLLEERLAGTAPYLVLDEGGAITDAPLAFVDARCAMIGLAEKGVATLEITATDAGGHASAPERDAPIAKLSRALGKLEARPLQPRLTPAVAAMLTAFADAAAGATSRALRLAAAGGRASAELLAALGGEAAALVRTTVAPTRLRAGSADNVIAVSATATLNCRILPGSSVAATVRGIRRRIGDDFDIRVIEGHEPSPISPTDDRFDALTSALHASWPDVHPVPYLMMAASDSRHFHSWCEHVYRFAPLLMQAQQRAGIHGENEQVAVSSLVQGERFHRALITQRGGSWTEQT